MSIGSIGSDSSWYWQTQATQAAQASAATASIPTSSSNAISNTGSPAASNNFASFLQAFSADLQEMLTQLGNAATTTATPTATTTSTQTASSSTTGSTTTASSSSSTTTSTTSTATATDPTSQTASNQDTDSVHHHHHHHHGDGDAGQGGSVQTAANQLVGDIGESPQIGSQTASGINNSASTFASDIMQAMQAYGGSTSTSASLATLV
jgi:hypothetical protein